MTPADILHEVRAALARQGIEDPTPDQIIECLAHMVARLSAGYCSGYTRVAARKEFQISGSEPVDSL